MMFCVVYLGFRPRLATERENAGENRIDKITELIEASLYPIHDLIRCEYKEGGELLRLNMPLELGIEYGCRSYLGYGCQYKHILILEAERYRFQKAISDLSGFDIQAQANDFANIIRKVRNWLVTEACIKADGAERIKRAYEDFH